MPKAQLRHLSLGFSTAYKLYQFHYCDAANCLISSSIIANNPIEILACGYIYHRSCYKQVVEPENNISCNDNDDESELIKYVAYALEEALRKFQQQ
ncbi:13440_t:CDS:2 [Funneliformis caledonium]|uniref:13440_t:CDS:1 n=1 Tax=Funneliformis caledonium TaxID=1117310 RepID=A0A9N9A4P4_9GLOM|nr:13440_t:CDS:2 [Funneliformis caledonium]